MPTQLSATPPARHRFSEPVALVRGARHAQHDLLAHDLHGAREVHLALRQLRLSGWRGGPPKSVLNAPFVIVSPVR